MPPHSTNSSKILNCFRIRDANAETDSAEILSIYTPFITHSITSFEFDVPTEEEMQQRIHRTQRDFPWIVCEVVDYSKKENGHSSPGTPHIAGYAYASKHRDREGYRWITETAIYLSEAFRGQGIGSILYKKLCSILTEQGYFQALAIIAGGNETSLALHKRLGFQHVGTWKNYGNKFGKWCDVVWYSKMLQQELIQNPKKPIPYPELKDRVPLQLDI